MPESIDIPKQQLELSKMNVGNIAKLSLAQLIQFAMVPLVLSTDQLNALTNDNRTAYQNQLNITINIYKPKVAVSCAFVLDPSAVEGARDVLGSSGGTVYNSGTIGTLLASYLTTLATYGPEGNIPYNSPYWRLRNKYQFANNYFK